MVFRDRSDAGNLLARKLSSYRGTQSIVFGLPRGGIVVAARIAIFLQLPLDVLVVKKIGAPDNSELAIGAVAPDGVSYVDEPFAKLVGADEGYIRTQNAELNDQIRRKIFLYQKGERKRSVKGKTAIVVDDGAATGATVQAAVVWLKKKKAAKIIVALPVAPIELVEKMKGTVNELVVLDTPKDFSAVGQFYKQFQQVTDDEVIELLRDNKMRRP
ncbi:phosphoribosyltransferase [Candidatus Gottesmanbacteria bacterium]|nr:phosphoribosyltransferase [Candidatus Gottesmanbacteria bacterium]